MPLTPTPTAFTTFHKHLCEAKARGEFNFDLSTFICWIRTVDCSRTITYNHMPPSTDQALENPPVILDVHELNRLDQVADMLEKYDEVYPSLSVYFAVARLLDATTREQFICAFASTHVVDMPVTEAAQFHWPIHYVDLRLAPLAGGHPRCLAALIHLGYSLGGVCDETLRRTILKLTAEKANFKVAGFMTDMIFAALRGFGVRLDPVIVKMDSFQLLAQCGYYQHIERGMGYFIPLLVPLQLETVCNDLAKLGPSNVAFWVSRVHSVLRARDGNTGFEPQMQQPIALHLEIGVYNNRPPQSVLKFFTRQGVSPSCCTHLNNNENAAISFARTKGCNQECQELCQLGKGYLSAWSSDLCVVSSFDDGTQPGFDGVLMYLNDDGKLFAVCLEMNSQISDMDYLMDLTTLSDKFVKFEDQLALSSKCRMSSGQALI